MSVINPFSPKARLKDRTACTKSVTSLRRANTPRIAAMGKMTTMGLVAIEIMHQNK